MIESTIKGAFRGFKRGAVFELTNGQVWEQTDPVSENQSLYRPEVKIDDEGNVGRMSVEGMDARVEVRRMSKP